MDTINQEELQALVAKLLKTMPAKPQAHVVQASTPGSTQVRLDDLAALVERLEGRLSALERTNVGLEKEVDRHKVEVVRLRDHLDDLRRCLFGENYGSLVLNYGTGLFPQVHQKTHPERWTGM